MRFVVGIIVVAVLLGVCLWLVLELARQKPQEVTVTGIVQLASGRMATNALVWVEQTEHDVPDQWERVLLSSTATQTYGFTRSHNNGAFVFSFAPATTRFLVKAMYAGLPIGYSGPWCVTQAPAHVVVCIQDTGPRFSGRFTATDGTPLTNVMCHAMVSRVTGSRSVARRPRALAVWIAGDGSYCSEPQLVGAYDLCFCAPGYLDQRQFITLNAQAPLALDVTFAPAPVITGCVLDARTRLPVPGVRTSVPANDGATCSPVTDAQGLFWLQSQQGCLRCEHDAYAPLNVFIRPKLDNATRYTILLSPPAVMRIRMRDHTGQPVRYGSVRLKAPIDSDGLHHITLEQWCFGFVHDGLCILSNMPTHPAPLTMQFSTHPHSQVIATSPPLTLTPHRVNDVLFTLPPLGAVRVVFPHALPQQDVEITVWQEPYRNGFLGTAAPTSAVDWCIRRLPADTYRLRCEVLQRLCLITNITVGAGAETLVRVPIDASTNSIRGSVRDTHGRPVAARIELQSASQAAYASENAADGSFVLGGLVAGVPHALMVEFENAAYTNLVIDNVLPNGPPLIVVVPAGYSVAGRIVDASGQPLHARILLDNRDCILRTGGFTMTRVPAGTRVLVICADGYMPMVRTVIVEHADLDLGPIVVTDRGVTLLGRIVAETGQPILGARVNVQRDTCQHGDVPIYVDTFSEADGSFNIHGMPRDAVLRFSVHADNPIRSVRAVHGPFCSVIADVGDIIAPRAVLVVQAQRPDRKPAAGVLVNGQPLDAQGMWVGAMIEPGTPMVFSLVPPYDDMPTSMYYTAYLRSAIVHTNLLYVRLPAYLWGK